MFYSQSYLARKSPLGTVWCAAHLQHRLRKSHYTSTDISSTVYEIMFPKVPMALRISGHLLFGVVRIYSKKVDYLYHDCNVVLVGLRKAFTYVDVNLPENATTAKFESITLPQTFDLDALEVDDLFPEGSPDNHLSSEEDITLPNQIPTGRDIYIAIPIDEDITMDRLPTDEDPNSGIRPMEDILPTPPNYNNEFFQHDRPSNQTEVIHETDTLQDARPSNQTEEPHEIETLQDAGHSIQTEILTDIMDFEYSGVGTKTQILNSDDSPPEIEVLRDRDTGSEYIPPVCPDVQNDATEPYRSPDQVSKEKEILSPIMEDILPSGGQSTLHQLHSEQPASAASREDAEIFDTRVSFGHVSPDFAICPTPPVLQPQKRKRKRKMFFDESTVLTNKIMKKTLEDRTDLLRKRRNSPSSAFSIWKLHNKLRKEGVFYEPSVSGLCADICNLYQKDYISTKPHLILEREANREHAIATSPAPSSEELPEPRTSSSPAPAAEAIPEPTTARSPSPAIETIPEPRNVSSHSPVMESIKEARIAQSPALEPEIDMEIERLRFDGHNGNDYLPGLLPSPARVMPSPGTSVPSSLGRVDFTPKSADSFGLETAPLEGTITSTETYYSELETPRTLFEGQLGDGNTGLSDIPEVMNTAEADDLYFLEADNTPAGSQGTQSVDSLSVRTRAVAQYLRRHSPTTQTPEDFSGDLSLNKILQGKTRKLCARMFFETLVLKSHGLIDVQQDQPYGDISLKLTSTLAKAQI